MARNELRAFGSVLVGVALTAGGFYGINDHRAAVDEAEATEATILTSEVEAYQTPTGNGGWEDRYRPYTEYAYVTGTSGKQHEHLLGRSRHVRTRGGGPQPSGGVHRGVPPRKGPSQHTCSPATPTTPTWKARASRRSTSR